MAALKFSVKNYIQKYTVKEAALTFEAG